MWEINNLDQTTTFLLALALGIFFSAVYDVFKAVRLTCRPKTIAVALSDVVYFLLLTLFTFCLFMLRTKGQPRGYAFFGELLGFILWRLTVSKYFLKILLFIFRILRSLFLKISLISSAFFGVIYRKITELYKKFMKLSKKGLKRIKQLLYNLLNRKNIE